MADSEFYLDKPAVHKFTCFFFFPFLLKQTFFCLSSVPREPRYHPSSPPKRCVIITATNSKRHFTPGGATSPYRRTTKVVCHYRRYKRTTSSHPRVVQHHLTAASPKRCVVITAATDSISRSTPLDRRNKLLNITTTNVVCHHCRNKL